MNEAKIFGIFPTPIYRSRLNRKFTKKEINFFNKSQWRPNQHNRTSVDNYILENKNLVNLKNDINVFIQDYFSTVVRPASKVFPYITQSWLNITKEKEEHHRHDHVNSYLSGVLYINAESDKDDISFTDTRYKQLKVYSTEYDVFNSDIMTFSVETTDIIIFPSYLTHFVRAKKHTNTRVSLSFNVFLKGHLGNENNLNHLYLK